MSSVTTRLDDARFGNAGKARQGKKWCGVVGSVSLWQVGLVSARQDSVRFGLFWQVGHDTAGCGGLILEWRGNFYENTNLGL